ncbi:MAG: DNA replication/repair protein RecF [Solobacterium sp.]|jgi:DNA replication and repair protein RecF|nr:DNA replication/repair protein RecF [Solobacterium sp.]MCH4226600.1 DNA replication/repair protein RecF [Solobacterium sp.]MCH4283459.1 DNA replication/repair protein RecF [Solobacterium sp.]
MIIKNLKLRNFRNYEKAEIIFNEKMNLITGRNAQGKTNLLESLVYLSLTRSHRISDDRKLIREGAEFADIQCTYEDEIERDLEAVIYTKGKTLLVGKQPMKKSSEFIGLLNVVLFAPDDLSLFTDAPKERRRMMNQEITKISSRYLLTLNQYQNLLKNRNSLLKSMKVDIALLDTLDEQMSQCEVTIVKMRKEFADRIGKILPQKYIELSQDSQKAELEYRCCLEEIPEQDNDIYQALLAMHQNTREKDMEYHMTTAGIHHDDLNFEMNGSSLINTASQGQKRMAMLAFKLSLLNYIEEKTGKRPVLLLDDVLSELDHQRQSRLLEMVKGPYQCLITATEVPEFLKEQGISEFQIDSGRITQIAGGRV